MSTAARKDNYKTLAREATRELWSGYQKLLGLQQEWTAQDYGSTLPTDPAGENAGLTAGAFSDMIFTTTNAIKTLMVDNGHGTNVTNLL